MVEGSSLEVYGDKGNGCHLTIVYQVPWPSHTQLWKGKEAAENIYFLSNSRSVVSPSHWKSQGDGTAGLCSNWIHRNCQDCRGQYCWKKKTCCKYILSCKLLERFTFTSQMYEKSYFKRLYHQCFHFTFLFLGQSQQ